MIAITFYATGWDKAPEAWSALPEQIQREILLSQESGKPRDFEFNGQHLRIEPALPEIKVRYQKVVKIDHSRIKEMWWGGKNRRAKHVDSGA